MQGRRPATLSGEDTAGRPIKLNGQPQTVTAPLPTMEVDDTACAGGDWPLAVAVSDFTLGSPDLGVLVPRSITLKSPGAADSARSPADCRATAQLRQKVDHSGNGERSSNQKAAAAGASGRFPCVDFSPRSAPCSRCWLALATSPGA